MELYEVFNPATGSVVGDAPRCREEDAAAAADAAALAWNSWHRLPVERRAACIEAGLEAVEQERAELSRLLTREQGKPLAEAEQEVHGFLEKMRSFSRLGLASKDGRVPSLPSFRSRSFGKFSDVESGITIGLVAWNYPVGLIGKKLGPALIGGNTVVLKPAFTTPLSALRVVELMNRGLPEGVLSCITGRGEELGAALMRHVAVRQIHLTGSDGTGAAVAATALPDTALQLELAGSDPMIVAHDANLAQAIQAAVVGRFRNCGQTCTAVKRLYVDSRVFDEFADGLTRSVERLIPGNGLDPATPPEVRIGPLHSEFQRTHLEAQLADSKCRGAEVLWGGKRPESEACAHGYFFEPTLVVNASVDCRLAREEVFGPVLPIWRSTGLDESIEMANDSQWDLSASLWIGDRAKARQIGPRIRCRQLWVNRLPFGIPAAAGAAGLEG